MSADQPLPKEIYHGFIIPEIPDRRYLDWTVGYFNSSGHRRWCALGIARHNGCILGEHDRCAKCLLSATQSSMGSDKRRLFAEWAMSKGYNITRKGYETPLSVNFYKKVTRMED